MSRRILVVLPDDGRWLSAFRRMRGVDTIFVCSAFPDVALLSTDISAAGIIVCADGHGDYPEFPHLDIATVFVGGDKRREAQLEVRLDGYAGASVATAIADAGRTRMALVGPRVAPGMERPEVLSFLKALDTYDLHLPRSLIVETRDDRTHAAVLVAQALDNGGYTPQAIFCTSAASALGVHDAVSAFGLAIPDEVTIVALASADTAFLGEKGIIALIPDMQLMVEVAIEQLASSPQGRSVRGSVIPYRMIAPNRITQATKAFAGFFEPGAT